MSRLPRAVGAVLLAVVLGAGATAGPAFGEESRTTPSPTTSVTDPTTPRGEPAVSDTDPTTPATDPARPGGDPTTPGGDATAPVGDPTTPGGDATAPVGDPTTPGGDPARPGGEPTTPGGEPTMPGGDPTTPGGEPSPAEPPPSASPDQVTDLRISASFERPSYAAHELISARASVTNAGDTAVTFRLASTGNLTNHSWQPQGRPDQRVEPGETLDAVLKAFVEDLDQKVLTLVVTVEPVEYPDADPADNTTTISVPVTRVYGGLSGTVYGDLDGDGALDPGEELAGHPVYLYGGRPWLNDTTTTDAAGRFAFTDLPAGEYGINFGYQSPWYFPWQGILAVDGVDDPVILARGTGQVYGFVSTTLAFDRQEYHEGETARLTATFVNNGSAPVHGLVGEFRANDGSTVDPGELGTGISVPAGATRSVSVPLPIGRAAWAQGHVSVSFSYGAPPSGNGGGLPVTAHARVLGGRAPLVVGHLAKGIQYCHCGPLIGPPLPGLVIFIRELATGTLVARTTTGPDGGFAFTDIPAGAYRAYVVGPWEASHYGSSGFVVRAGENGTPVHVILAFPGPEQADPGPVPTPPVEPAPGGDPAPGAGPRPAVLAATGVGPGIAWLALGGLLLLAAGTALVLHPTLRSTRR
ncbi:MAG: hypothetical protein HOV94_18795 [Saccharothrix sp.]|nr:hypothetical protein [Saccharothrix sp.]